MVTDFSTASFATKVDSSENGVICRGGDVKSTVRSHTGRISKTQTLNIPSRQVFSLGIELGIGEGHLDGGVLVVELVLSILTSSSVYSPVQSATSTNTVTGNQTGSRRQSLYP